MVQNDLHLFLKLGDVAESAVKIAADFVFYSQKQKLNIQNKGYRDIVTDIDFRSQKIIVDYISNLYPDHGFLTEESMSGFEKQHRITWIIDPIDGTINYSRCQPIFCISIGVAIDSTIVAGVIFDVKRNELFKGIRTGGFFVNDALSVSSQVSSLQESIVAFDFHSDQSIRTKTMHTVSLLSNQVLTMSALGSAALALAWVACGRFDGYFNFGLSKWDIAAASVMLEEAKAKITHVSNEQWNWTAADKSIIAANKLIHDEFTKSISNCNKVKAIAHTPYLE